ncbi:MAG: pantetheine-phosphate adenylyltransferase [Euryarchaeota archaeon]|nr:pantetheine-phosphate adenylyltransferase [Euryarchaeota archaeon]
MFNKVAIGGTFNVLHKGHKALLTTAFMIGKSVDIGLASDEFANRFRATQTRRYEDRKQKLIAFIEKFENKKYEIIEIRDSYGIATTETAIDCIVVCEETLLRAEEINAIRFKKGLSKLVIVVVPIMLADDGKPISGERILNKEIDEDGKLVCAR